MKTILITGFDPFNGEEINPSWELAKRFDQIIFKDYQVISKQLPTAFYRSQELLKTYINQYTPEIIICLGQAGKSETIRLERVAINLNDASIPDNDGIQPIDEIIKDKNNAYFSTLPIRTIQHALKKENIPVSLSLTCGTYVCNHVFYHLMDTIQSSDMIGGFIHIPYIHEQTVDKKGVFSMDLKDLESALTVIINTTIEIQNNR